MNVNSVAELLSKSVKEDRDIHGLMVYNFPKQEVLASTFSPEETKKFMEVEKLYMDLELEHATKVDPAGERNWLMVSLSRKIVYSVKITKDIHLYADLEPSEAPSAAIEDGLELALMIGRML